MSVSVFDLFKIGIGPSSSHTVGPMIAARQFSCHLQATVGLAAVHHVVAELFGSLSATGIGHGTDTAVLLGLAGHEPDTIDPDQIAPAVAQIRSSQRLPLLGEHSIPWIDKEHMLLRRKSLPRHPNGLCFRAFDAQGQEIAVREYYSIGGGFVVDEQGQRVTNPGAAAASGTPGPWPGAALPVQHRGRAAGAVPRHGLEHGPGRLPPTSSTGTALTKCNASSCASGRPWPGPCNAAARPLALCPAPCMCAAARPNCTAI